MFRWIGKTIKYGAVVLVLTGGTLALFGQQRVKNLLRSVKQAAEKNIDDLIPDEVKLRNDMDKLREEYPRRIAEIQSMIDELDREISSLEKDRRLCREVLAICEEDLGQLQPGLEALGGGKTGRWAMVEFRGASFSRDEALERTRKILGIKDMYDGRLKAGTGSVGVLQSERERLKAELDHLRGEYDQFLAEYRSLEVEINLLRRNEKLIELTGRRERPGRVDSSGWTRSLHALKAAIARLKTEQEEKLKSFELRAPVEEYETRARLRQF